MTDLGHEGGEKVGTEGMHAGLSHDGESLKEMSGCGRGGWGGTGRAGRTKADPRWPPPAVSLSLVAPTGRGSTTS